MPKLRDTISPQKQQQILESLKNRFKQILDVAQKFNVKLNPQTIKINDVQDTTR